MPIKDYETRFCFKCGTQKAAEEKWYGAICKGCRSEATKKWQRENPEKDAARKRRAWEVRVRKTYGMEPGDYERILEEQNHCCAVCLRPLTNGRRVIDHCHVTGKVRGILHSPCNTALGAFGDDPIAALRAATYLFDHQRAGSEQPRARGKVISCGT